MIVYENLNSHWTHTGKLNIFHNHSNVKIMFRLVFIYENATSSRTKTVQNWIFVIEINETYSTLCNSIVCGVTAPSLHCDLSTSVHPLSVSLVMKHEYVLIIRLNKSCKYWIGLGEAFTGSEQCWLEANFPCLPPSGEISCLYYVSLICGQGAIFYTVPI